VLRPGSTAEVAAIVRLARTHHVGLVPQGGNTGLVGGGVPRAGEVVVDLRRLARLGPVDTASLQVTVGAGVTLAALQRHAGHAGLAFAVDLGARDTATIGGMVATNAGGLHVLRHGAMRAQVLGLEAVLGTGDIVAANPTGLVKDNTGYDLPGLLCGSEGTLGIVTSVRLRLLPAPARVVTALLGVDGVAAAVDALAELRGCAGLHAAELLLADGMALVGRHLGLPPPLDPLPPCAVLVELAGDGDLLGQLGAALDRLGPVVRATAVADDEAGGARLWRWREAHPEVAAAHGIVHKADVSIPLTELPPFVDQVAPLVAARAPGAPLLVYGHLGDGNLHVNVATAGDDDGGAVDAVLALALDLGGSVSAEHGIGVAKVSWLLRQRGAAAVRTMAALKAALDPDGICNPGVLLPA
jgi:FAD/FMN-containing dehydrogenase